MPTVADFAPAVTEACSKKSLPTYKPHFRRLVEAHGDLRLDQVTPGDLQALRDRVIVKAGTDKINRALANGRALLSYQLDAHGHSAGENCVRAMRYFFKHVRKQRLTRDNPAMEVAVPKRPPAPERPLLPWELEQVALVVCVDRVAHIRTLCERAGDANGFDAVVAAALHAAAPDHPITRHTSLLYWPGGDREYEDVLFAEGAFDRVVVWGSAETVASVRQRTPLTKTVALNPRYGVSLVRPGAAPEEAAARASIDSLVWEQQACTASLIHYVEGTEAEVLAYAKALAAVLARWDERRRLPLPRVLQGRIRLLRRGEWVQGTWLENTVDGQLSSAVVYMRGRVDLALHPMSRLVVVRRVEKLADVPRSLTAAVSAAGVYPPEAMEELRDPSPRRASATCFPWARRSAPTRACPTMACGCCRSWCPGPPRRRLRRARR